MARSIAKRSSSTFVIYAAIVGNLLVAATKLGAAAFTGSSAMLSEGVHSMVDTGNELLLLYGMRRAGKPPDREHPLGHGRELYFWSFVVALLVFALGAVVSLVEGVIHIVTPRPIESPTVSYVVLLLSALFDGTTWLIALKSFKKQRPNADVYGAIKESKDPPSFMVLFEDSAAVVGIVVALVTTFLSVKLDLPVLDGVGSVVIGLVLALTALLLARETKGLLIGESADPAIVASIQRIARELEGVDNANSIVTVHLAPKQILVAMSLEFDDDLKTPELEAKVRELERRVCATHDAVVVLFVKPQSAAGYREARQQREERWSGEA